MFWNARCSVSSGIVADAACAWMSADCDFSSVPVLSMMFAVVVFVFTIDVVRALLGGLLGAVLLTVWHGMRPRGRPSA